MKHRLLVLLTLTCLSASLQADVLGVYGAVGYWHVDFSGDSISDVSLDKDFSISSDGGAYAWVAIEHPLPFIPNIKVAHNSLKDSGTSVIGKSFAFNGTPFVVGQTVVTEFDLRHTDVTLYYEMLDVGYDLDLGLTVRAFDGELNVSGVNEDLVAYHPLIYARAKFGLPFTGLYLGAELNGSGDMKDYQIKLGWETENFILPEFGVELGYRKFTINADADTLDVDLDVEVDGVFMAFTAHF